jgi:hypothetical protein
MARQQSPSKSQPKAKKAAGPKFDSPRIAAAAKPLTDEQLAVASGYPLGSRRADGRGHQTDQDARCALRGLRLLRASA